MAFLERVGVVVLLEEEELWICDVAERVERWREWLLMEKEDTLLNREVVVMVVLLLWWWRVWEFGEE